MKSNRIRQHGDALRMKEKRISKKVLNIKK
jgi:hypothetical protein